MEIFRKKQEDPTPFRLGKEFKIKEEERGYHSTVLHRSKENPHILVKELRIPDKVEGGTTESYSEKEFREHYQESLNLLRKHLDEYLPDIQLVYGRNRWGGGTGYMIVREVISEKKKRQEEKEELSPEKTAQLDKLFVDIIKMWLDKSQAGENRLVPDFTRSENIKYGHTEVKPDPQFYIVDTYPLIQRNKQELKERILGIIASYPGAKFNQTEAALKKLEDAH